MFNDKFNLVHLFDERRTLAVVASTNLKPFKGQGAAQVWNKKRKVKEICITFTRTS